MSVQSLTCGEVVEHRIVTAVNAVACATCGTMVLRRGDEIPDWRWSRKARTAGLEHVHFPATGSPRVR